MLKYILIIGALIFGIKSGSDYIFSEKFQSWADQKKAPWTCDFNNNVGRLLIVMSEYEQAHELFKRSYARCPEGPSAELSEYEIAHTMEEMGHRDKAADAYRQYVEKYKDSKRAKLASRSIQIIKGGL